jgi:hypothetical protein
VAGTRAVFFCYRIPHPDHAARRTGLQPENATAQELPYTEEAGETRWFLYDLAEQRILEEPTQIIAAIRCAPETPRHCEIEPQTLASIRATVERHIKNTRLKQLNAPVGVKPVLKCWMELN